MPQAIFDHTIPASEQPQTYVLDRVATVFGKTYLIFLFKRNFFFAFIWYILMY